MDSGAMAYVKLAAFLAVIFGPMCVPHAVITWRDRRRRP
jgi:hypothetical protein